MTNKEQTEVEFLESYDDSKYAKPNTTVDVVIFTMIDGALNVLLIKRAEHPFKGQWAIPGGFINVDPKAPDFDPDIESAAKRELLEETGVQAFYLEQLHTFGSFERDPRHYTISIAYFALMPEWSITLQHGSDAEDAKWWPVHDNSVNTTLAFDHDEILSVAVERLHNKVEYSNIAVHLLQDEFTLPELQKVYESLLGLELEKSAFRRKVNAAGFVEEIKGKKSDGAANRPAQVYRFKKTSNNNLFFPRKIDRM